MDKFIFAIIVFIIVIVSVQIGATMKGLNNGSITVGVNGLTEKRCIEGYLFLIGEHGQARQVLDEFGKGARCEKH